MTEQEYVVRESNSFIRSLWQILWHTFSSPVQNSIIETRRIIVAGFSDSPDIMASLQQKPDPKCKKQPIHLHKEFKLVLLAVFVLTVGAGITHIVLAAIWPSPTENQQIAFETMASGWKIGLGAICGLVGGKAS